MTDKGVYLFDECAARCVHLSPREEESVPLFPEETIKYTYLAA